MKVFIFIIFLSINFSLYLKGYNDGALKNVDKLSIKSTDVINRVNSSTKKQLRGPASIPSHLKSFSSKKNDEIPLENIVLNFEEEDFQNHNPTDYYSLFENEDIYFQEFDEEKKQTKQEYQSYLNNN